MRIAVIGCGSIGTRHIRNAISLGHEVSACDLDKTRRGEALWAGASLSESEWRWISEPDDPLIDAVMICTPASTHASVARDLLSAGYRGPLFVEKPLALSLEECEVFQAWPHQTTQVGYMLRFHSDAIQTELYRPSQGILQLVCDMSLWPGGSYAPWIYEASHEIDLALFFGAAPVVSNAFLTDTECRLSLDHHAWQIVLRNRPGPYVRAWGTDRHSTLFTDPQQLGNDMYLDELRHFLGHARDGSPTRVPFEDGVKVLQVIAQAQLMAGVTA